MSMTTRTLSATSWALGSSHALVSQPPTRVPSMESMPVMPDIPVIPRPPYGSLRRHVDPACPGLAGRRRRREPLRACLENSRPAGGFLPDVIGSATRVHL